MIKRGRFIPPKSSNLEVAALGRAIAQYFDSLNNKNSLTLDSATGLDNTPVGAHTASTGAFTSLTATGSASVGTATIPTVSGSRTLFALGPDSNLIAENVAGASNSLSISQNAVFNSGWKYIETAAASDVLLTAGTHVFRIAASGTAGAALTWVTAATIDVSGNFVPGTAALATNATNGFTYIETCAGAPTGVPTAYTGRAPMVYDSTNNKLYVYNGAWKSVTLA